MPRPFTRIGKIAGRTKPTTKLSINGPSHWVDLETGQTIRPSFNKGDVGYRYTRQDGPLRGTLDIGHLIDAQSTGRVNRFQDTAGKGNAFATFPQAIWHLRNIAFRKLKVQALRFEVQMAKDAVNVFRRAFTEMKFQNPGASKWKELSPYTKKQRLRYGTDPNKILTDTWTLRRSIHAVDGEGRVITDPNMFGTARRHKGVCYAGIHNDPKFFNARNVKAHNHVVAQRQFMGHTARMERRGWEYAELMLFNEIFTPIV